MDRERALNLTVAAELAGLTVRELRQHLKDGHLPQTTGPDGKPRVTIGDLADAGLVPHELAGEDRGNGRGPGGLQTWSSLGGESGELLQRLLLEREQAASAWKERSDLLYRELVDDQRNRIDRLEDEKRELTDKLHDALRQIPKLLELEKLEASARESEAEADRLREEASHAQGRLAELERQLEQREHELERENEKRVEAEGRVRRLRERGLWSRVVDSEPPPPADA